MVTGGSAARGPQGDVHALVTLEGDRSRVALCACGWRSDVVASDRLATELHRQHGRRAVAVAAGERARAALERAQAIQKASGQRLTSLGTGGRRSIQQPSAVRERRVQLRLDAMRRLAAGVGEQRWLGADLERARALAGLKREELWVSYFGHGGSLSRAELGEVLQDRRPIGRFDHDVLVLTLNEAFDEAGLGTPVDYWEERRG